MEYDPTLQNNTPLFMKNSFRNMKHSLLVAALFFVFYKPASSQSMYISVSTNASYWDPCAVVNPFCTWDAGCSCWIPCCFSGSFVYKQSGAIYSVDLSTCSKTLIMPSVVGTTFAPLFQDIAIYSGDPSIIYGISNNCIYKIDVGTGVWTLINSSFNGLYGATNQ